MSWLCPGYRAPSNHTTLETFVGGHMFIGRHTNPDVGFQGYYTLREDFTYCSFALPFVTFLCAFESSLKLITGLLSSLLSLVSCGVLYVVSPAKLERCFCVLKTTCTRETIKHKPTWCSFYADFFTYFSCFSRYIFSANKRSDSTLEAVSMHSMPAQLVAIDTRRLHCQRRPCTKEGHTA